MRDKTLFQINASDFEVLKNNTQKEGIGETEHSQIETFWKKYLMTDEEIKKDLIDKNNNMAVLYEIWESSPMKNMTLTSVGIAIAHAYTRSKTGESDDLRIWIN